MSDVVKTTLDDTSLGVYSSGTGNDSIGVTVPIPKPIIPPIEATWGPVFPDGPLSPPIPYPQNLTADIVPGINGIRRELCWCWETVVSNFLAVFIEIKNDIRLIEFAIVQPIVNIMIGIAEELLHKDQAITYQLQQSIFQFEDILINWVNDHEQTPPQPPLPGTIPEQPPGNRPPAVPSPGNKPATPATSIGSGTTATNGPSPTVQTGGGLRTTEPVQLGQLIAPSPYSPFDVPPLPSNPPTGEGAASPVPPSSAGENESTAAGTVVCCPSPDIHIHIEGTTVKVEGGGSNVYNVQQEATSIGSQLVTGNEGIPQEEATYYVSEPVEEGSEPIREGFTGGITVFQTPAMQETMPEGRIAYKVDACFADKGTTWQSHWPAKMLKLREAFVELGNLVSYFISQGSYNPYVAYTYLLKATMLVGFQPYKKNERILPLHEAYEFNSNQTAFIKAWHGSIDRLFPRVRPMQMPLMALRTFLQAAADEQVSSSMTAKAEEIGSVDDTKTSSAGVGLKLSDTGGSWTGETKRSDFGVSSFGIQSEISKALKPYIVCCLELLDFFIQGSGEYTPPSVADCVQAYMRGGMTEQTLRCILDLYGCDWSVWESVVMANRQQQDTTGLVDLWRRGLIDDKEFNQRMQLAGWKHQSEIDEVRKQATEIPGPSDIIRFMLRDVEDPDIVDTFGLDEAFERKFQGLSEYYAKAKGLSTDLMKRYWRAHWDIPSPTQLYTMLQRLRPDRLGPKQRHLHVTKEHVKLALIQDDILPFWEDRLIAIAYHPLTRTDVRRMYFFGVLTFEDMIERYQDVGYHIDNARVLAEFQRVSKADWLAQRPESRAYQEGVISRDELRERLNRYGVTDDDFVEVVRRLRYTSQRRLRSKCIAAMRKQYLHGGINDATASQNLVVMGFEAERVEDILNSWRCERDSVEKSIPATTLCKWYKQGLISRTEFTERLVRLGYDHMDAANIIFVCEADLTRETDRKTKQDEARRQREEDRLKRESERLEARRNKEAERLSKQLDKELEQGRKRYETLRKTAIQRAEKIGVSADDLLRWGGTAYQEAVLRYHYPPDDAAALVIDSIRGFTGTDENSLLEFLVALIKADEDNASANPIVPE